MYRVKSNGLDDSLNLMRIFFDQEAA